MNYYERKIFPKMLEKVMSQENYAKERAATLKYSNGRVLEIGFGTGLNLPHYPSHIKKIEALDINPGMNETAYQRMNASGIEVKHHCLSTEKLPFKDNKFDTVVSTWTLCSINDLHSALIEVSRILKPGGQLLFLEHGLADTKSVRGIQHTFTPIKKIIACGCRINIPIDETISQAGFKINHLERFILDNTSAITGSMYRGVAISL